VAKKKERRQFIGKTLKRKFSLWTPEAVILSKKKGADAGARGFKMGKQKTKLNKSPQNKLHSRKKKRTIEQGLDNGRRSQSQWK